MMYRSSTALFFMVLILLWCNSTSPAHTNERKISQHNNNSRMYNFSKNIIKVGIGIAAIIALVYSHNSAFEVGRKVGQSLAPKPEPKTRDRYILVNYSDGRTQELSPDVLLHVALNGFCDGMKSCTEEKEGEIDKSQVQKHITKLMKTGKSQTFTVRKGYESDLTLKSSAVDFPSVLGPDGD